MSTQGDNNHDQQEEEERRDTPSPPLTPQPARGQVTPPPAEPRPASVSVDQLSSAMAMLQLPENPPPEGGGEENSIERYKSEGRQQERYHDILSRSMRNKMVNELPGMGTQYSIKMAQAGFNMASEVLGQFLVLGRDEEKFLLWLKNIGVDIRRAVYCFVCILDWYNRHLRPLQLL